MRTKTIICDYSSCTGCAACVNVCPCNAVHMISDICGYRYPEIDPEYCVNCGLCERICPVLHPVALHTAEYTYAVAATDENLRKSCSSGGVASTAAQQILNQGGIVYGCAQMSYRNICHVRVETPSELDLLKGSKYVHSEIDMLFRNVKEDLNSGHTVLFSGTPCQVAGIKNFLGKDYPDFYTLDLICHGVPSQQMLIDDIKSMLPSTNTEANKKVSFRWKTQYGIQYGIQFGEETKRIPFPYDPYILAFYTGLSFRENCHRCTYSQISRVGDITVGDFWGLGAESRTKFKIHEGVSLVLVNTEKGQQLWKMIMPSVRTEQHSLAEAVGGNANLRAPSQRPAGKDLFLREYGSSRNLKKACKISLSKYVYLRFLIIENIKKIRLLVMIFKKIRFLLYKIRHKKETLDNE